MNRFLHAVLFPASALLLAAGASFAQKSAVKPSLPGCEPLSGQFLRCPKLGFSYKVPFGWVDRTADMQEAALASAVPAGKASSQETNRPAGKTLLATFERPPGTSGSDVNSAVVIAIEDQSAYPQVKTAGDYFGPLADLAQQRGLKMDGDPYLFSMGSSQLVRADFVGGKAEAAVRQTSLAVLGKGYILSFTFLASSDDEIESLMENLAFTSAQKARK